MLGTGGQARPRDLLVDPRDQGGPPPEPHGKDMKGYGWCLGLARVDHLQKSITVRR